MVPTNHSDGIDLAHGARSGNGAAALKPPGTRALVPGAIAGVVGTAVLELIAPIERTLLGREPPFAPPRIAAGLARWLAPRARPTVRRLGPAMQWTYGVGLGTLYGVARGRRPRPATLALAILAFEAIALPPIVGKQLLRPAVLGALALHIVTYAIVVARVDPVARRMLRRRPCGRQR